MDDDHNNGLLIYLVHFVGTFPLNREAEKEEGEGIIMFIAIKWLFTRFRVQFSSSVTFRFVTLFDQQLEEFRSSMDLRVGPSVHVDGFQWRGRGGGGGIQLIWWLMMTIQSKRFFDGA